MHGGPSQVDLLDPKPMLNKYDGQAPPAQVLDDENRTKYLLGTPFKFHKHGESGIEFSDQLSHIAKHADKIAVIRSMFTEHRNHEHAIWMAQTGLITPGRPTLGAWAAYGLGTINQNLPAYVALPDPAGHSVDGVRNWSSGWLPPVYQGTAFRSEGTPVLNLKPTVEKAPSVQAGKLDLLRSLNAGHKQRHPRELDLDARITNLELAARMQLAATDAMDITRETKGTQAMYGLDKSVTASYGKRCLMARRLVERGVRYVQIMMKGQPWDTHTNNVANTKSRWAPCWPTFSSGACLIQPWFFGVGSLVVLRELSCVAMLPSGAMKAETIIPMDIASGWRAVVSRVGRLMAKRTNLVTDRSSTALSCPITMPRSCTCSDWIMRNWTMNTTVAVNVSPMSTRPSSSSHCWLEAGNPERQPA